MLPAHLIGPLAQAADAELLRALQSGATRHGQLTPTGEVGFVAAAVLAGVPAIAHAWRPLLAPNYHLSMTGVFCHQTPRASFIDAQGNAGSCELADLLIVADDLAREGHVRQRWAVLIQTKMAANGGGQRITDQRDLRQLDLYTRWPAFTLPSAYNQAPRDFATCQHAGSPLDSGRYGLIDRQPTPLWHQQAPAQTMPPGGDQLGSFLAHMLATGQTGYGREATGTGDDWSRTIDDLMTITYAQAFTYSAGFGPNNQQQRGHTTTTFVTTSSTRPYALSYPLLMRILREDEFPPLPSGGHPEIPPEEMPDGRGISLVHIGITNKERFEP